eukprot:3681622-Prorocentrum_lima.AAC.1
MTSSLVGSEMCIRDRLMSSSHAYIGCSMLQSTEAICTGAAGQQNSSIKTCLLYTSDAADDM